MMEGERRKISFVHKYSLPFMNLPYKHLFYNTSSIGKIIRFNCSPLSRTTACTIRSGTTTSAVASSSLVSWYHQHHRFYYFYCCLLFTITTTRGSIRARSTTIICHPAIRFVQQRESTVTAIEYFRTAATYSKYSFRSIASSSPSSSSTTTLSSSFQTHQDHHHQQQQSEDILQSDMSSSSYHPTARQRKPTPMTSANDKTSNTDKHNNKNNNQGRQEEQHRKKPKIYDQQKNNKYRSSQQQNRSTNYRRHGQQNQQTRYHHTKQQQKYQTQNKYGQSGMGQANYYHVLSKPKSSYGNKSFRSTQKLLGQKFSDQLPSSTTTSASAAETASQQPSINLEGVIPNLPIFCDMDGVLVDFNKGIQRICGGKTPSELPHVGRMWAAVSKHRTFFQDLDWTSDGPALWQVILQIHHYQTNQVLHQNQQQEKQQEQHVHPITILTGVPNSKTNVTGYQKYIWCQQHLTTSTTVPHSLDFCHFDMAAHKPQRHNLVSSDGNDGGYDTNHQQRRTTTAAAAATTTTTTYDDKINNNNNVDDHQTPSTSIKVISCWSKFKYMECKVPGSILIDDRIKLQLEWEKAGGIFVHHTDTVSTIAKLERIFSPIDNS